MISIYLVDDEFFVRTSLKKNLPWKENGFEVVGEANNGKAALEDIIRLRPDIAIVDINMPIYDGLELIRRLQENRMECRYIILTGYNEFEYARQALRLDVYDYILKPIDYDLLMRTLRELGKEIGTHTSLSQKISDLESEKKERILEEYYNDLVNSSSVMQEAEYYDSNILSEKDLNLDYSAYAAAVIQTAMPLISKDLREILDSYPFHDYICSCNAEKRIFLIFDSCNKEEVKKFFEFCMQTLEKLSFLPHIGVGRQYLDPKLLYRSYNEAQIALRNDSILKKGIIYYEELKQTPGYQKIEPKLLHRLKGCILERDIAGAKAVLNSFFGSVLPGEYLVYSLIFNTMELIHLLTDTLSHKFSMPVSVMNDSDSILDVLNSMTDVNEIKNWTIEIYTCAMKNCSLFSKEGSDVTTKIEDFIQENYMNPELSIPMLSECLFLNYSYLCACFKRDRGMTINDYLNDFRIQKAVEMFQSGVENVTYVAEMTGFNNAGYFSKKFKKEIGLTPSEYIKTCCF